MQIMAIKTALIQGPLLATLSALLFGISPVLCKMVIGEMSPVLLAGLLYLGSGIGLSFVLVRQRINIFKETRNLSRLHRCKLLGPYWRAASLRPCALFMA